MCLSVLFDVVSSFGKYNSYSPKRTRIDRFFRVLLRCTFSVSAPVRVRSHLTHSLCPFLVHFLIFTQVKSLKKIIVLLQSYICEWMNRIFTHFLIHVSITIVARAFTAYFIYKMKYKFNGIICAGNCSLEIKLIDDWQPIQYLCIFSMILDKFFFSKKSIAVNFCVLLFWLSLNFNNSIDFEHQFYRLQL